MRAASGDPRRGIPDSGFKYLWSRSAAGRLVISLYLLKRNRYAKAGVSGANRLFTYDKEDEKMLRKVRRGELYFADLSPVIGSEQDGYRPVLIIQNNVGNYCSPTVIVAALTGKINPKSDLPTHHIIGGYAGLKERSVILLEQIRTIDKKRLRSYIGTLNENDMKQVNRCLAVSLAM